MYTDLRAVCMQNPLPFNTNQGGSNFHFNRNFSFLNLYNSDTLGSIQQPSCAVAVIMELLQLRTNTCPRMVRYTVVGVPWPVSPQETCYHQCIIYLKIIWNDKIWLWKESPLLCDNEDKTLERLEEWLTLKIAVGVPNVAKWVKNLTAAARVATEVQVWPQAWHSGLKDLALLQLWYKVTDAAGWRPPYAVGVAIRIKNKQTNKNCCQIRWAWERPRNPGEGNWLCSWSSDVRV